MNRLSVNENNYLQVINKTSKILKKGGLVVFPSDTVYGLLVDATNEKAVKKLIEFKNRPPGKAISVFISDFKMLNKLSVVEKEQLKTIKQILPGPFTVVLRSRHKVNPLLESEKGTLGIRMPMYRYIEVLIRKFGKPITATSANLAGRPPHYSVDSLLRNLPAQKKELIDLIVDAGKLFKNKPSTVVDLTTSEIKVLRKGDFDLSKKKKFISRSSKETITIAKTVISDAINYLSQKQDNNYPLVFIIQGELGVGKTVFVRGMAESLGIKNIISPTYVIYYEYEIERLKEKFQKSKLIHIDLYNIEEKEEFEQLKIKELLAPENILCFEWGEKAGEIYELLKSKAKIIYVKMRYIDLKRREINVIF